MLPPSPAAAVPPSRQLDPHQEARLRDAAQRLEASFLKEMLSAAGLGRTPGLAGGFGGGTGEDQFASFLLDAQAAEMARAGGIGLAESLFEAMAVRDAS